MHIPKTLLVLLVPLLIAALPATAQTELVATHLELETEAPLGDGSEWDGSSVSGRLDVALCSDQEGGVNPTGGSVVIEATVSAPAWVEVQVSPETIELAPATGPEPEPPGCMDSGSFSVEIQAGDVQPGQSLSVDVALAVAEDEGGDEDAPVPAPAMGTYAPPAGESTGFTLQTAAATQEEDDGDDDPEAGAAGGETGESPLPGVAALFGMITVGTLLLRRRRD